MGLAHAWPHYKIHTSVYQHSQPGVHEPSMIKSHVYNKVNAPSPPKAADTVQPQYLHVCNVWYSPLLVALHEGLLANLHEEERSPTERKITGVKLKEY